MFPLEVWLYRNGIQSRGQFLFESYCLSKIAFSPEDVVVDCGSNSGDLFIKLSKFIFEKIMWLLSPIPPILKY